MHVRVSESVEGKVGYNVGFQRSEIIVSSGLVDLHAHLYDQFCFLLWDVVRFLYVS